MGLESRTRGSKGPTSVTGSDKRWIEFIHDNRISRWRKWTDKLTVHHYETNIFLCHLQMSTHGKHLTNFKCCKVLTRCHYNTCVNCKASVFFFQNVQCTKSTQYFFLTLGHPSRLTLLEIFNFLTFQFWKCYTDKKRDSHLKSVRN